MYRTDFWTLWEKARVGCFERTASKHVYYQRWNRSPAQVGCMRQVLGAGALGRPRGMGWGGRWERGSAWGTHVNPWLIHVNVWQKPLQYCKGISLQLIKINGKKKKWWWFSDLPSPRPTWPTREVPLSDFLNSVPGAEDVPITWVGNHPVTWLHPLLPGQSHELPNPTWVMSLSSMQA